MTVTIQLREEDLREANANAYVQKGKNEQGKISVGLIGWCIFIVLVMALWELLNRRRLGAYSPEAPEPVYDLTMAVLPGAVAAIWFLTLLAVSLMMQVQVARRRAAFGEEGYKRVQKGGWVGLLLLVALAGLVLPQFVPAIEFRGGRFAVLMIAFVPWVVAALVVLGVITRLFNRAVVRNSWEQKPSLHGPIVLEMDDQRLMSRTANSETTYRWSAFLRFRETENLFVLVTEDVNFLMVPKRDLDGAGLMMEFRAMIQTHIAEGYFLTVPDAAFPVVRVASLPPPPVERMEMRRG